MTRRYALDDGQWERIKDLLPGQTGQPGATARDNRLFIDAVLYRYQTARNFLGAIYLAAAVVWLA